MVSRLSGARKDSLAQAFHGRKLTGLKALEIGCATGDLGAFLKSTLNLKQYDGVEPSSTWEIAAQKLDNVFNVSAEKLRDMGQIHKSYDLVVCCHALEHLVNPVVALSSIVLALKDDGELFIEVPNRTGSLAIPIDENKHHLHSFSVQSLAAVISNIGFEINKIVSNAPHSQRYSNNIQAHAKRVATSPEDYIKQYFQPDIGSRPLFIWGIGSEQSLDEALSIVNINQVAGLIDSDKKKQGSTLHGKTIHPPDYILSRDNICVLINTIPHQQEILKLIESVYRSQVERVFLISDILKIFPQAPNAPSTISP
jgi:2-polyprenyl-3-methyl-5-hydroxy-6-metoxy-1,4-benzoquinol methylase